MNASRLVTFLGMLALAFWATSIAYTRLLAESLGPYSTVGFSFLAGGLALFVIDAIRFRRLPRPWAIPRAYLWVCGPCFVAYLFFYGVGFAKASSRDVILQLTAVNYLWPALTLLFAVGMFPCRVRWVSLLVGIALSLGGVGTAVLGEMDWSRVTAAVKADWVPYALVVGGAVTWALYSAGARKFAGGANGMPLFQVVGGLLALGFAWANGEAAAWGSLPTSVWWPFVYYALFVAGGAYWFWDVAMQKGDLVLLGVLSYFLPLLSVLFSSWRLDQPAGQGVYVGCVLLVAGAALCRRGATLTEGVHQCQK